MRLLSIKQLIILKDSSNIPLCAIIGLMYGIKNKDTIFTKCSAVALFVGIACIVYTLLVIKST